MKLDELLRRKPPAGTVKLSASGWAEPG